MHTQTGPITIQCAAKLSAQCNDERWHYLSSALSLASCCCCCCLNHMTVLLWEDPRSLLGAIFYRPNIPSFFTRNQQCRRLKAKSNWRHWRIKFSTEDYHAVNHCSICLSVCRRWFGGCCQYARITARSLITTGDMRSMSVNQCSLYSRSFHCLLRSVFALSLTYTATQYPPTTLSDVNPFYFCVAQHSETICYKYIS